MQISAQPPALVAVGQDGNRAVVAQLILQALQNYPLRGGSEALD